MHVLLWFQSQSVAHVNVCTDVFDVMSPKNKQSRASASASSARKGGNKLVLKRPGKAGKALASSSCAGEKVAVRLRTWDYNAT